jgi:hypothetical protein
MTTSRITTAYVPLSTVLGPEVWPSDTLTSDGAGDKLAVEDVEVYTNDVSVDIHVDARVIDEVVFPLPLIDSVGIVLGGDPETGSGAVGLQLTIDWSEDNAGTTLRIDGDVVRIRFARDLLVPATKNAQGKYVADDDEDHFVEIDIPLSLLVTSGGTIELMLDETSSGFSLSPCFIGDTGCVIEAQDVVFALSQNAVDHLPASVPRSGRGLYLGTAAVHLPEGLSVAVPSDVVLERFFVGSGGFSGKATGKWTPTLSSDKKRFEGNGAGELFGIPFGLETLSVEFRQNTFVASSLSGKLLLPFFDGEVDVDIALNVGGGFSVGLSSTDGLFTLTKDGILQIELDAVSFEITDGVFTTKLSGKLTPLFGADKGLKWPTFDVKDLTIDSKGHVKLPGGWLSLAEQKTFDFHGFKIEISQIGFGKTDDGGKWVGFSGGLKLVDGFRAGASVEGLRITWYDDGSGRDPKITLNGVGVELTIPGVLYFKGDVSYRELAAGNEVIHRFDGDIKIELETPDLKIDGTIVVGSVKGPQGRYNFFAIYTDVELPTGIPLASTGLAIYGFAGLFALQMEPNKKPEELWFSVDHSKSYFHRSVPGMTDLKSKWEPHKGSFALGAGITLGTMSDNGFTFNGKFLLGIVCPGPLIFIQGAASILKKKGDKEQEGQFRALAIYDGRASSVTIGVDAEYKTGKGGELIEIAASMEAFYAFHDPTAWHLWIGKDEPRSLRIRALFARIVEANAYFMLDAHALALGAWYGYNAGWNFGPLSVRLEAWAEGNAKLSVKPAHFHGDLWIHGLVDLEVFGFGLGISLDARIAADLFRPFHLRGEFSVGIKLPWPFKKKFGATVILEWGPRKIAPPLPLPLAQLSIEHLKTTAVWPLPRGKHLLPNWDDGGGFIAASATSTEPPMPQFAQVPLAPLDARISLTFGRSVHDGANVGVNLQPIDPDYEEIGDPATHTAVAKVRYSLDALELNRWNGTTWQLVAHSPKSGTTPALFGSWMPVPQTPTGTPTKPGQTKLLVWSKSPFDFTRATGSSWEEWVSDALPDYPCIPLLPSKETCFGFESLAPGTQVKSPWTHHGPPDITLSWGFGPATVEVIHVLIGGHLLDIPALCFPAEAVRRGVTITSSQPGRSFRIVLAPAGAHAVVAEAIFTGGISGERTCVDLRKREPGTLVNPWTVDGVRFLVHAESGALLQQGRIERWGQSPLGLNAGFLLEIELPCASPWVELIVTHRPPFRIVAFNAAGAAVATHAPFGTGVETTETIRLEGADITRIEVHASGNEKLVHSVCYQCTKPAGPTGTGYDVHGHEHGPFVPINGTIEVTGPGLGTVVVSGDAKLCIEQICITPDPEAGQATGRDEMIEHMREELVRWHDEGAVLAPNSVYQLRVWTSVQPAPNDLGLSSQTIEEHAYFRTEGPPGITKLLPPEGTTANVFDSGLDDLARYVRETDPPTVPPAGQKPILYRPFYRAYDIGVEFNEDYVEQMYRMDSRDLGLYLFDNSNQPVRDAKGALLVLQSTWGTAKTITLSESDTHWVTLIDSATCLPQKLDPQTFPHASTLASASPERVLAPDTLHEARLVPLLLHERFAALPLGNVGPQTATWYVEDSGAGGPSQWQIGEVGAPPSRFAVQQSAIGNATPDRNGTLLLRADSSQWTDYRVTAYVRSEAGGAVGLVVRHQGPGTGYRFALDDGARRLGAAEDHFAYQKKRDYRLTVEAIGSAIRAYVDGEQIFEIADAAYAFGRIGLYVCQSPGARFADVSVDDLRKDATAVYRFSLTTSLYANFFHHVHSFQDEVWKATLAADPAADAAINQAVTPSFTAPDEKESRAFETLADKILGPAAHQNAARVEITRAERSGAEAIYLVRSPEPIVPARTEIALSRTDRALPAGVAPENVKLTGAASDAVTLLLRDGAELTRHRVELRQFPGALDEPAGDPVLWLESFADDAALDRFTVVDSSGASQWRIEHGGAVELSGIGGGNEPELPGTHLVGGDTEWTDYRVNADFRADGGGAIGLLLRYRDENNYYRLSLGATLPYRRLVKCVAGQTTVLWNDASGYTSGEPFTLALEAVGAGITGFLANTRLFSVVDSAHPSGRAGIYVSANKGARCERIEARRPSLDARASFADRFAEGDLAGWTFTAATGQTANGELQLDSTNVAGGAFAFAGDATWTDVIVQARVRSGGGTIGIAVRAVDIDHFYRFSMGGTGRELVKSSGGATSLLWQDGVTYEANRMYELTLMAVGGALRGFVDGVPLFSVADSELAAGRIALYSSDTSSAWFSGVRVWPAQQAFDRWRDAQQWSFVDDTGAPQPEWWIVQSGGLRPAPPPPPPPPDPGTGLITAAVTGRRRPSIPPDRIHYAISTQPELTDMRLVANVTIDMNGAAGIVFGWKDTANHTALWLDAQRSTRRLVRTEASIETILWQDSVAPATGHPYTLTMDHADGRLMVYLDAVPIVALDLAARSGRVAFALRTGAGSALRGLRIAEPQWICWRGFGEEEIRPAGTRVRAEPEGYLRIGDGAALRVVGPDGHAQHTRSFPADSTYSPIAARVLRKADGTAFFLIPPQGTPPTGSMRLAFTYHRARTEAGRPMSQAGDRTPEQTAIDFD